MAPQTTGGARYDQRRQRSHRTDDDDESESSFLSFQKQNAPNSPHRPAQQLPRKLQFLDALLGGCLCEPLQQQLAEAGGRFQHMMPFHHAHGGGSSQFVELHGIRFIGLGAVTDELTARERVYDTLLQLTTRTERLLSIGNISIADDERAADALSIMSSSSTLSSHNASYLRNHQNHYHCAMSTAGGMNTGTTIMVETLPLDVWNEQYPHADESMTKEVRKLGSLILNEKYVEASIGLSKTLQQQKNYSNRGHNKYLAGITAHNLAVVEVLSGHDESAVDLFEQAIALKEAAFGPDHLEVALSLDELGIQKFAREDFEGALDAFREAHKIRREKYEAFTLRTGQQHPSVAMVLNNIACCNFSLRNYRTAILNLQEAASIQQQVLGATAQAVDLDLLHVATVLGNCGYLCLCLKHYDEARTQLEEALLIQQSVLDDNNHRAIRDTLSNIEFTNAFHD